MEPKLEELKARLMEINDLNSANAVLGWDQSTYMPPAGGPGRGRQMALLAGLAHAKLIDPLVGRLLDELRPLEESLPYEDDDASLIRVARRDYERAARVPAEFMARLNKHGSESYMVWAQARPDSDFNKVLPYLEKTLELSRELANFFPGYDHIADPLIAYSDFGMKAVSVRKLFADLRTQQVPIVNAINSQEPADDSCIRKHYPEMGQLSFCSELVQAIGYDLRRGRIDKTHHPFTTTFSTGDVRITTRVRENYLGECLFSNIHEAGHALYELGVNPKYDGTPLMGGTSAGVHESQSRLWENMVGRSRNFWEFFYPRLQKAFPDQLKGVSLDGFYRAINKVENSFIRTDADEVTYNLHVMLRFEFELSLLEGSLAVKDLPEAWAERFKADLGITPPNNKDGCMQDVHWFGGLIGGSFQGYTLGNVIAAQLYQSAIQATPEVPAEIRQGKVDSLRSWLTDQVYQHGRKFTASELVKRVTGTDIRIDPYIQYLRSKYSQLYKI